MLPSFDVPPIGTVQGKVWGSTQLVFVYNSIEVHRISILDKGYCSIHQHQQKWNRFVVTQGTLDVVMFWGPFGKEFDPAFARQDITTIARGGVTDVSPGIHHQFQANHGPVEAIEIYWTTLDALDIERLTVGGLGENK